MKNSILVNNIMKREIRINCKNCILLSLIFIAYYSWIGIKSIKRTFMYENASFDNVSENKNETKLKYILQWSSPSIRPFAFMGKGQNVFLKSNCSVNNCYVTANRSLLKQLTEFDAILFHGREVGRNRTYSLPKTRLPHQMYVFACMEPSAHFPIIENRYQNFFNWTWTYKLNSDLLYEYIKIRNIHNDVIGPNQTMNWLKVEEMEPIDDTLKVELSQKKLFAAWFVSRCKSRSKRETYVKSVQDELRKYNNSELTIDVYGKCGPKKCPRSNNSQCTDLLKKFYYFYFSFENSFAEDYVTEKLLTALQNNVVPVVYGGANYSRFMPDSAYLDGRKLSAEDLVRKMIDTINNEEKYYDFFRWKNHYSYHSPEESAETNHYCRLCSKINEEVAKNKFSSYSNIRKWWNN